MATILLAEASILLTVTEALLVAPSLSRCDDYGPSLALSKMSKPSLPRINSLTATTTGLPGYLKGVSCYFTLLSTQGFFKHFLRKIKLLKDRHDIASEIKKLKVQVEDIKKRHDRYFHLNEATSSGTITRLDMTDRYSDPQIINHFVEETQLVGINQSRDKILGWVMDENYLELTAISLISFGGLGKTTLAKTVYDHLIIIEDARLNTEQLLNMMDELQLVKTIRDHLHGKRYLLVLDDVWSIEAWKARALHCHKVKKEVGS
ncbi:hypothetical protein ZIOFF_014259 [Zingiber officinale]|uniref:NB-ARC domain-containing protein n=1 Tax=Zingiber officinale TaxID=94328 RepID=A0A8J5HH31_ZINOF|nr:hypothetical protein ZIOFF_014259 [Zingiber officinale]